MRFRTVVFDCDSTLSAIEGIEELSHGHRAEVSRLTSLAMSGAVPLEDVYGRRLDLIRPTRLEVDRIGRLYIERAVPGALETVRSLLAAGVRVQVLSGGLTPPVAVLATHLGIVPEHVAAVDIFFDSSGAFAGFDHDSLLVRAGGKRRWLEERGTGLPRPILLVGDGATDLEARPAVDAFAAFTGVVDRPEVSRRADHVIPGPSLAAIVPLVLPAN
jgi:phosphoserine phosphatase